MPEQPSQEIEDDSNEIDSALNKFVHSAIYAQLWLLYTFLYWTMIIWIPILINLSFSVNLSGFIVWCCGFIGIISSTYTIYYGLYPYGSTKHDKNARNGIGRYSAAILTSTIMIDCFVLLIFSHSIDIKDSNRIYNINYIRLLFHIIHIFWTSTFFYSQFKFYIFIVQWIDILWLCIVSYTISSPNSVDIVYFIIITVKLCGWMIPMMFIKSLHSNKYEIQYLLYNICTIIPIIAVILITAAYKTNEILWFDVVWKSILFQRLISMHLVKIYKNYYSNKDNKNEENKYDIISFCWLFYVSLYWTICVWVRCGLYNEISLNYEYYLWLIGMIGTFCLFDINGKTKAGKQGIAFCCFFILIDFILHAYLGEIDSIGIIVIILHSLALISSSIFYIDLFNSFKKGIKYSYIVEIIDIILMFIVIQILHQNNCFSMTLCIAYFVVFIIKLIFCFTPIILGYTNYQKYIHHQMVLLDSFTDLPLIFMIIITKGYQINAFVFVDIAIKIIILLISYSYHLIINILLKDCANDNDIDDIEHDDDDDDVKQKQKEAVDDNNNNEIVQMMTMSQQQQHQQQQPQQIQYIQQQQPQYAQYSQPQQQVQYVGQSQYVPGGQQQPQYIQQQPSVNVTVAYR